MKTNTTQIVAAQPTLQVDMAVPVPQTYDDLTSLFVAEQDIKESSRALYRRTLTQFFRWLHDRLPLLSSTQALTTIRVADLNEYKASLQDRGLSKLSICSYIVAVRKFYEWCEAKGWWYNMAKSLKTPSRKEAYRKQHLTEEKSSELLTYFRKGRKDKRTGKKSAKLKKPVSSEILARDFAIVNLILRTGLRTIEIVRADIGDITFKRDRRVLKVWGKGRTDKEDDFVVLSESAYKPIEEYISKYRKGAMAGEPLFTSVSVQNKGKRLTTRTISGICKEGLRKVDLDGKEYTAHSLRHTTAVAILKSGGSINEVQAVLRHSSVDTSRIYTKSIEEEMRLLRPTEYKLDRYFH